jgi:hypothetical protein
MTGDADAVADQAPDNAHSNHQDGGQEGDIAWQGHRIAAKPPDADHEDGEHNTGDDDGGGNTEQFKALPHVSCQELGDGGEDAYEACAKSERCPFLPAQFPAEQSCAVTFLRRRHVPSFC